MPTERRFRLDSATGPEVLKLATLAGLVTGRGDRAADLLLHWWRLGFDPATALRCPECRGSGEVPADPLWLRPGDSLRDVCQACGGSGRR